MPRRSMWVIFAVLIGSLACYERADRNPYGRWLSEAIDTIDRQYLEPVDEQVLFEGALDGMVRRLDDYSSFLPRRDAPQFQQTLDQQYGGIGIEVVLDPDDKQLTVANPMVGTPAYKAGIRAGDRIIAIDGQSTANLQIKDVVRILRGKPGAEVTLTIRRADQDKPLEFHLVRALIKIDSILGDRRTADGTWNYFLPGLDRIGYIRLNSFGDSTVSEFEAALKWLSDHQCRGLILDLRNNPGGLLSAAEQICDLFIPKGEVIVSTRGRDGRAQSEFIASGDGPYQKLPLVVMVNELSASASEIVAACLQDHDRATVVGVRTWGKGTVQNVIPLEGGRSLLKLTIASYWRPSGKNIHRLSTSDDDDEWGVTPDEGCAVKLDEKQTAEMAEKRRQRDVLPVNGAPSAGNDTSPMEFDPQLKRAVEALDARIASPQPTPAKQ